jgi:D-ribose pyranose/furanose isomerase RbsD
MDFIIGFLKTIGQHDEIMVVVDMFIPIKSTFKDIDVANIFM